MSLCMPTSWDKTCWTSSRVKTVGNRSFRAPGTRDQDWLQLLLQDFSIEKEDGAKRLILGGSSDLAIGCKLSQKCSNLLLPHGSRMALLVKQNVAADPIQVGLFGTIGVVPHAEGVGQLIE